MNSREKVGSGLGGMHDVLEIGALNNPIAKKDLCKVIYVDHTTTDDLKDRFKDIPWVNPEDLVNVDAVWGEQTLQQCIGENKKVDYVIASHVIEHVPDLIAWLQELRSVLKPGGEVRLIVPDKRFTFDCARDNTQMPVLIDAHLRQAKRPLPHLVADFYYHYRDVNLLSVWNGDLDTQTLSAKFPPDLAIKNAKAVLDSDHYDDIHCWVFTPQSFSRLMSALSNAGFVSFECCDFQDTQEGTFEFTVFLRPTDNVERATQTWDAMEQAAAHVLPRLADGVHSHAEALERANALISDLTSENEQLRIALNDKDRQINDSLSSITAFRNSTSWKVTAPLRYLSSKLK